MSADRKTLQVYADRARDYAGIFERAETDPALERFIGQLKEGAFVLDLGCGPAAASAVMRRHGFAVDPVDASQSMIDLVNEKHGLGARLATFDDLDADKVYDGVWANFSLLHAPRESLGRHLHAIFNAVKPGGIFHLGMKTGEGEQRDRLGRYYCYFTKDELCEMLEKRGFAVFETTTGAGKGLAGDVSPWVTILSRKPV